MSGFAYRRTKEGTVFVSRDGRDVTTLRGESARRFEARVAGAGVDAAQQLMARVTGNYRRGNERR